MDSDPADYTRFEEQLKPKLILNRRGWTDPQGVEKRGATRSDDRECASLEGAIWGICC